MVLVQSISTDYTRIPDLKFLRFTTGLHEHLLTSTVYPNPTFPLDRYLELVTDFGKAVQAVATGLKAAIYDRDRTRLLVEAGTRSLSTYATETTPDRPDQWAEATFPLTKAASTPRPVALPVTNFVLTDGNSKRSLAGTVARQASIYGYLWRIHPKDGPGGRFGYETLISHTPDILIAGLDSGTAYEVECAAWNDSGPLEWSEVVTRIVQ